MKTPSNKPDLKRRIQQLMADGASIGDAIDKAFTPRKRGRPQGSRTKIKTPAVERAEQFFVNVYDLGMTPTKAADDVADKNNNVDRNQVFKEKKRHEARLCDEMALETEEIKKQLIEMEAAACGPQLPNDAYLLCWRAFAKAIKPTDK